MSATMIAAEKSYNTPVLFNGTYTIESPKGGHKTFDISTVLYGNMAGKRIISILAGPDNTTDYVGFGFVNDIGIAVWKKHKGNGKKSEFEIYADMVWSMAIGNSKYCDMGYKLLTEGTCIKCNRKLTTPESIKSGIGPTCAEKM